MLRVVYKDSYENVGLAVSIAITQPYVPNWYDETLGWANDFQPGYLRDTLLSGWSLDFPVADVSAYWLIDTASPTGLSTVLIGNQKPDTTRRYSPNTDWNRHGTIIGGLLNLGDSTTHRSSPTWQRESDTWHPSARGLLELGGNGRDLFPNRRENIRYGRTLHDLKAPGNPTASWIYTKIYFSLPSSIPTFTVGYKEAVEWGWSGNRLRLDELILDSTPQLYEGYASAGYNKNLLTWNDSSLEYDCSETDVTVRWKYTFVNHAMTLIFHEDYGVYPEATSTYDVETVLRVHLPDTVSHRGDPAVGRYPIRNDITSVVSRKYYLRDHWSNVPIPEGYAWAINPETNPTGVSHRFTVSVPHITHTPGALRNFSDAFWTIEKKPDGNYDPEAIVRTFHRFVDSIHDYIRPMCALSSNDALSNYQSSSNFLESLPELPSMLKHVKDLGGLARVIKKIARGDFTVISDLVDLLAGGYLTYKYGAKPLASDIQEAKRIASEYAEFMVGESVRLQPSLYGKFSYSDFPDDLPFPGKLKITARSKIVVRNGPGQILGYVITLNDVGILPTLARIWDLVPFSFVIDWFTNLDDRYEAIDSNAILASLDVDYYIHSFLYELTLDQEFYAPFREKSVYGSSQLRVYTRERSLYHPLLKDSKYDFFPPSGLKRNLLAAGALLWVLK